MNICKEDDKTMETFLANEDQAFQLWLSELISTHESFQSNPPLAAFAQGFLNRVQDFHKAHGNHLLYCRGQQRHLVTAPEAAVAWSDQPQNSSAFLARWYDFVHVGPHARHSGPTLGVGRRRFETIMLKIQAARNRSKFGMTDDTGYLFPCLQHNLPRACFMVLDHYKERGDKVFILHGNKKFAGQGDDGEEEGTSSTHTTDMPSQPAKCFPGTEHLKPTHYICTWKANGKNAGVYGYTDSVTEEVWLFVNSKGVCECAGLLTDVMKNPLQSTTFSDNTGSDLLPQIFRCFQEIWVDGVNQQAIMSLWKRGYLLLFEFNDNKHIVLEYGKGGRPIAHLAFIGLVQLPPLGSVDTAHSGLVFRVDKEFTFDLWRGTLQGPPHTCKPTLQVKCQHFQLATQELMKGRFFHADTTKAEWFDPDTATSSIGGSDRPFLAGEGAVCYEMAQTEAGDVVIRQLFKAKTASYITHRQFREFLKRRSNQDVDSFIFESLHRRVLRFYRQKLGDLAEKPYPDPREFCSTQSPQDVVAAASLFYTHFAMWLQGRAMKLNSTVVALLDMTSAGILVPADSCIGQDYVKTAKLLGLLEKDICTDATNDECSRKDETLMLAIPRGMAFQLAEFTVTYGLDHSKMFAAPKEMIQDLEEQQFHWAKVPTGYEGTIKVGFFLVFPDGVTPRMSKVEKKKGKKQRGDILGPFRQACATFLWSNPAVQVNVGHRNDNPDSLCFESKAGDTLCVSHSVEEFSIALLALPSLITAKGPTNYLGVEHQRLTQDAAANQATETLGKAFPTLDHLFGVPADLQFGDVVGRLVPVIKSPNSTRKMLIIRGVSGVGKSSVAKGIQQLWGANRIPVVEADSYFGPTCPYHPDLLPAAHADAQNRAREALDGDTTLCLIVSNTGIAAWEYAEYLELAVAQNAAVSILTLDTQSPLENLENLHNVPQEKVEKMARGVRASENNPEGKTIEEIFKIAEEQKSKVRVSATGALAWTLLGTEGASSVREIYAAFLEYAKEQGIAILHNTVRPPNPHSTLVYVRPSKSTIQELTTLASIWDKHGSTQEMTLGEIKYSFRTIMNDKGNQLRILLSLAVAVTSFAPDLVPERSSPHITIAYDPDRASAVDSIKLWQADFQWPEDVSVGSWNFLPSRTRVSGVVETGVPSGDGILHREQMPDWLRTREALADQLGTADNIAA